MSHLSYCLAELTAVTDAVADLHAKAMHAWQSGAHQLGGAARVAGGALDAVELEDESSDGGGGVATALPGSRRLALSESFWQRVAAEGGAGRGRRRAKTKFGIVVGRLGICITVVVFSTEEVPYARRSNKQ